MRSLDCNWICLAPFSALWLATTLPPPSVELLSCPLLDFLLPCLTNHSFPSAGFGRATSTFLERLLPAPFPSFASLLSPMFGLLVPGKTTLALIEGSEGRPSKSVCINYPLSDPRSNLLDWQKGRVQDKNPIIHCSIHTARWSVASAFLFANHPTLRPVRRALMEHRPVSSSINAVRTLA